MKRTFTQFLAAVVAALAALAALAAASPLGALDTNSPSSSPTPTPSPSAAVSSPSIGAEGGLLDLSAFRLISERNIFNPNRSIRGDDKTTRREPERRVRTESFSLLGTMSYEKGRFAFFDGSNSDYRKVLQAAGQIAGFKVTDVAPTCVKLEATNGQSIELCVGMQMSKHEEEDWRLHERAGADSTSSGNASSGAANAGESSDLIKRLMERRQSEGAVEPTPSPTPAAAATEKKDAGSSSASEPDEIVRRLLQKREQELNK
jgi:hypothetical protein